ncbi:TPA: hypothetical protein ACKMSI_001899, partial [Neisseria gonorrhoeae]
ADFSVAGGLKNRLDLQPLISGRLKNKKQPAQPVFLAANLNPNSRPVLSPCGRELERGQQAARLVLGRLSCWKDCHHSENALSPALPHGGGSGFRQIFRLPVV